MSKKIKTKVEDAAAAAKTSESKATEIKAGAAKAARTSTKAVKSAQAKPAASTPAEASAAKPGLTKAAKVAKAKSLAATPTRAVKSKAKAAKVPAAGEVDTGVYGVSGTAEPVASNRPLGSIPRPKPKPGDPANPKPRLTISSKNYSSWSLRGWLICKLAGLDFDAVTIPADDPSARAELLLMAPSYRVPRLRDHAVDVWDTLAIADYLHETHAESRIYPREIAKRAHCRAVSGEMHSGFANLRSALPFNIKGHYPGFKVWAGAQADIDHICEIWRDCLTRYGGPFLFGEAKTIADAMYAPVCSRFVTYDVQLDELCASYRDHIMALKPMKEWIAGALEEPDEMEELDMDF